jgi:hypothetical protein
MHLSEAIHHEETPNHRALIMETNGFPPPPSSLVHASSPTQMASDLPVYERQSSLPPSSPPIYADDDIPEFSTMPGPFLSGDDPDFIYDDYSGAWGLNMPCLDPELRQPRDDVFLEDKYAGQDLLGESDEEFEGEAEDAERVEYFGSLQEAEDLTESGITQINNPDDWWPWANRKVRV